MIMISLTNIIVDKPIKPHRKHHQVPDYVGLIHLKQKFLNGQYRQLQRDMMMDRKKRIQVRAPLDMILQLL